MKTHAEEVVRALAPNLPTDPAGLHAARAEVDRRMKMSAPSAERQTVASMRRPRARLVAAAALLAGVLVLGPAIAGRQDLPTASAASEVLTDAAESAAAQPAWSDPPYWHVVTEVQDTDGTVERREEWWARIGDSVVQVPGTDRYTVAHAWSAGFGGQSMSWDQLDALPTDADRLGQVLREAMTREYAGLSPEEVGSRPIEELLFERIGDTMRLSPASPELRAALWRVAASIPGVRLLGDTSDSLGRAGVAVELGRQRLLVDPDTGELLEWYPLSPAGESEFDQYGNSDGPLVVTARWTVVEQGPAQSAPSVDGPQGRHTPNG